MSYIVEKVEIEGGNWNRVSQDLKIMYNEIRQENFCELHSIGKIALFLYIQQYTYSNMQYV